jgi:hypothetical protein
LGQDLILKDVTDPIVRENFARIQEAFRQDPFAYNNFKFFEVDIASPSFAYAIPHGLSYVPRDILLLSADGDYNFYFRYDDTDRTNIYVAAHGPVRLRFLAGTIPQVGTRRLPESSLPFVAPLSGGNATPSSMGAGSDGWAFIQDSTWTPTNPIPMTAGQRVLILNDGAGPLTNYVNAPANASSWWDKVNSVFWPSKLGEFYTARVNFRVKPVLNNVNATLYVDIGTANPMISKTFYLTKGAATESMFSESLAMPISNAPFSNGIKFFLKCDCNASLYGINLTLLRDFHL